MSLREKVHPRFLRHPVHCLTRPQQVSLTSGSPSERIGCDGIIVPVPSVGFPGMCLQDNGQGVKNTDFVNAYPPGIHVGAR